MKTPRFEANEYVLDIVTDAINEFRIENEEDWNLWLLLHASRIEQDADDLFVNNS